MVPDAELFQDARRCLDDLARQASARGTGVLHQMFAPASLEALALAGPGSLRVVNDEEVVR